MFPKLIYVSLKAFQYQVNYFWSMSPSKFPPFPLIYCPTHQTQSVRARLCSDPSVECRLSQSGNSRPYCSSHFILRQLFLWFIDHPQSPPAIHPSSTVPKRRKSRKSLLEKENRAKVESDCGGHSGRQLCWWWWVSSHLQTGTLSQLGLSEKENLLDLCYEGIFWESKRVSSPDGWGELATQPRDS